jgi:hypothetical protein
MCVRQINFFVASIEDGVIALQVLSVGVHDLVFGLLLGKIDVTGCWALAALLD